MSEVKGHILQQAHSVICKWATATLNVSPRYGTTHVRGQRAHTQCGKYALIQHLYIVNLVHKTHIQCIYMYLLDLIALTYKHSINHTCFRYHMLQSLPRVIYRHDRKGNVLVEQVTTEATHTLHKGIKQEAYQ